LLSEAGGARIARRERERPVERRTTMTRRATTTTPDPELSMPLEPEREETGDGAGTDRARNADGSAEEPRSKDDQQTACCGTDGACI
jgi:hypothetical protein